MISTFSQQWILFGVPFFVALQPSLLYSPTYREVIQGRYSSIFPSSKNLTTFSLSQIHSLIVDQESSLHLISRVFFFALFSLQTNTAILESIKSVRESVLRTLTSDSSMEFEISFDPNVQKTVTNLVNMSDLLSFYPALQQLYFRSVRTLFLE